MAELYDLMRAKTLSGGSGGSSDFAEPIELDYDEETSKYYFHADKLDILRLHKPFMFENLIFYCAVESSDGDCFFYVNLAIETTLYSPFYYLLVDCETNEISVDSGEPSYYEVDLTVATITGGTLNTGDGATISYYLDKTISYLNLTFTATSNNNSRCSNYSKKKL